MSAALLVAALRDPGSVTALDGAGWNALIAAARAERLIGTLALTVDESAVPDRVRLILADARLDAAREARQALWEADRTAEALGEPVLLLKGTAYAAAGLKAGEGRFIGDLDILLPKSRLKQAEERLIAGGWEWVKEDAYDDSYYRQWMHELPPMIHRERDRMIDVHHTILPLTARPTPNVEAMLADAVPVTDRLSVLAPEDMICHSAAHLFADGDLAGGLRNLWDIHCLYRAFCDQRGDFGLRLLERAEGHQLYDVVSRALRVGRALYGTPVILHREGAQADVRLRWSDRIFIARLLARDGWGRETRKLLRFAFYVRSHWLRMPPLMLAGHLLTKWRKGHRPA